MYSMTGYGRGTASLDGRELTIELKSVNNRFLDIGMKLPRQLSFLEDGLRKLLNDALSRGHVDVFVNYRNLRSDAKTVRVDEALLKAYLASARESAKELDLVDDLTLSRALALPDVTTILPADEDQEALAKLGEAAMTMAIEGLKAMRRKEGERLKLDLAARMDTMTGYAEAIEQRAPPWRRSIGRSSPPGSRSCWARPRWTGRGSPRRWPSSRIGPPSTRRSCGSIPTSSTSGSSWKRRSRWGGRWISWSRR